MTASRQLQLGCSLHAIHSAMHPNHYTTGDVPPLFAVSPGAVYNKNTLLAILIRIYYFVLRVVFRQPAPPPTEEALRLILNTFFNHMVTVAYEGRQRRITHYVRSVAGHYTHFQEQRYSEFIRGELHGSIRSDYHDFYLNEFRHANRPLGELELKELNHASAAFVRYISAFWEKCVKGDAASNQFIAKLRPYLEEGNQLTLLDKPLYDALLKEEYWGYIEGLTSKRIPVDLLAKLHDPANLTIDERTALENWVGALNQNSHEISAQQLSTVLDEVAQIILIAGAYPTTFVDIVYWLHQNGCQAIDPNAFDAVYIRSNLNLWQPGQEVVHLGERYTLGSEITNNNEPGTCITFELQEQPGLLIKIPRNRVVYPILMKEREDTSKAWGFPYPKIIAFDPKRCFLIEERIIGSFSDHQWTSSSSHLTREDQGYMFLFASLIRDLHRSGATIRDFTPSDIKLTAEGECRFTRQFEQGEASYSVLEQYCIDAAAGNPFILQYLMNESELYKDPRADHYRQIVSEAFARSMTNVSHSMTHQDEVVRLHAQSLYLQAKTLKDEVSVEVERMLIRDPTFPKDKMQDIPSMVSGRLIELYRLSPTPGHLAADLRERVVNSFRQTSSSSSSSD